MNSRHFLTGLVALFVCSTASAQDLGFTQEDMPDSVNCWDGFCIARTGCFDPDTQQIVGVFQSTTLREYFGKCALLDLKANDLLVFHYPDPGNSYTVYCPSFSGSLQSGMPCMDLYVDTDPSMANKTLINTWTDTGEDGVLCETSEASSCNGYSIFSATFELDADLIFVEGSTSVGCANPDNCSADILSIVQTIDRLVIDSPVNQAIPAQDIWEISGQVDLTGLGTTGAASLDCRLKLNVVDPNPEMDRLIITSPVNQAVPAQDIWTVTGQVDLTNLSTTGAASLDCRLKYNKPTLHLVDQEIRIMFIRNATGAPAPATPTYLRDQEVRIMYVR